MAVLTIASIGLVLLALVAVLVYIETKANFNQTVEIIAIVCVAVAGVILLFAIYASFCGKYCALSTLGGIFIVFFLALAAAAICVWSFESKIDEGITEIFEKRESQRTEEEEALVRTFEETFHCCGYGFMIVNTRWCREKKWDNCKDILEPALDVVVNVIGGICVVAAFFMLCGIFTACLMAKRKKEKSSSSSRAGGVRYKA